jgi:uncharacterized protein YydD (DUF2326 family)
MRLVNLSANVPTFRSVSFNRSGLSLIVAEQRSPKTNKTSTYNGVGKSLMLELLHFCLGSNAKKVFQKHLPGWIFILTIEIDGENHTITRSTDNKELTLDGKKITFSYLKEFLEKNCFEIPPTISHLSFRSLIQRFIRSGRDAYSSFFHADGPERADPYGAMLRNAFLLGLDLHLAKRKYDLRQRERKLKDTMNQLQGDPLFAEIFAQDKIDIELLALREQAEKLSADLRAFQVAEDYHAIEQEANRIKRELDRLRREGVKLDEAMGQIDRSLQTKGDLPQERVFALYKEAQQALPDRLRKRVEEVIQFQRDLQQRRIYRLTRERQELDRQRRHIKEQMEETSARLDERLRYLSEHRALDEYVAVSNQLSEVQQRVAKLEESKALRERVNKELRKIDLELADQNIATDEYLEKAEPLISEATTIFRDFARELYGSRPSGLSIGNDDGENQLRYRIDAHITSDAAEGINEAKIFCYDMTLLRLHRGHRVEFLVHDSTLFGPVDPRQRLTMLRIADRKSREHDTQYIATLNLHDITSLSQQTELEPGEFERLFSEPAVVLRLGDDAPESKLLGIDVDMNYLEKAPQES